MKILSPEARERWRSLSIYEKFEHVIVFYLSTLIAIVVIVAVWQLSLNVLFSLVLAEAFDLTDYVVFQTIFGMIFTVIIALEFKRSLLVVTERRHSVIQVRTVILLAMLAIVRKLIIVDLNTTDAWQLGALALTILALGAVHWLVREQDRREAA